MSDKNWQWSPETRRVTCGKIYATLHEDGTIAVGRDDGLINTMLSKLDSSEVQDLLVALDAVQGDQPDPNPADLRNAIITGAHAVARDVYRLTAYRAIVDVGVHPHVFHTVIREMEQHGRSYHGRNADMLRGSVRIGPDVEISVSRELSK